MHVHTQKYIDVWKMFFVLQIDEYVIESSFAYTNAEIPSIRALPFYRIFFLVIINLLKIFDTFYNFNIRHFLFWKKYIFVQKCTAT